MTLWEQTRRPTVASHGASAGCILCGCGGNNQGLRIRVLQDQKKGNGGPLTGDFVILDVGDNKHSAALEELLDQVTNAQEVLRLIRGQYSSCVSVANGNILALEQTGEKDMPT
jgi:hypothetical protein